MNRLFGLRLEKAALIVGCVYVIVFLYASIHASINLARTPDAETASYSEWGINTDAFVLQLFILLLSIASLISSAFLIVGSLQNNRWLLLPWLIVGTALLAALSLSLIFVFYVLVISVLHVYQPPGLAALMLVANIFILALKIYIWLGIKQLYTNICEGIQRVKSLPATVPLYSPLQDYHR